MIYTSSELDFQGDSEFQLKKFKISSVAPSITALCFRHISGKCDLHQSGWPIHHQNLIFKGALNIQSEFKNSISGTCHGHISVWGRLRENITPCNQDDLYIILTAFSRGFWPSDQNFEIPSVAAAMAISVFEADWKYYLLQSRWFIHHPDRIFQGVPTIWSEFWNSINGICYGHISIWGRLRENIIPSNQDDLYIILIEFSRGFRPSDQNFEIPSVASAMAISVFEADCGKILSPPIRMIYTSSWSHFPGGSDHPIRILKFYQWHLLWSYQYLRQIAGKYYPLQSGWFIHHPDHIFKGVLTIWSKI